MTRTLPIAALLFSTVTSDRSTSYSINVTYFFGPDC